MGNCLFKLFKDKLMDKLPNYDCKFEMVTWTQYRMVRYGLHKQGKNGIDYQQVGLSLKKILKIFLLNH